MGLELPKTGESKINGVDILTKECKVVETEFNAGVDEIMSGNAKALANLVGDETLSEDFRAKKAEELRGIRKDLLRFIEGIRSAVPDNYAVEEVYDKAA